jgi:hypothetical protein
LFFCVRLRYAEFREFGLSEEFGGSAGQLCVAPWFFVLFDAVWCRLMLFCAALRSSSAWARSFMMSEASVVLSSLPHDDS